MALAESPQTSRIARDQRCLLLAAPCLQLTLSRNGFREGSEFFGMYEVNGAAYRGVARAKSAIVPIYARDDVGCMTNVECRITATKDVDVWNMVPPRLASLARDTTRPLRMDTACHERAAKRRVEWCGRGDSNPYGLATASPSSWCVCQFRHFRDEGRTQLVTS